MKPISGPRPNVQLVLVIPMLLSALAVVIAACGDPEQPREVVLAPAPFLTATVASDGGTVVEPQSLAETWVADRLRAVAELYDISAEGRDLLVRLDVRQIRGEPGFFGSYGYDSWTGVGEAKPATIMHELGHAYWGAFPIAGVPELTWETPAGEDLSPALKRYHADVLQFMKQPPGPYEPFRSRLRNLPELSEDNLDGLVHMVEADIVSIVGGDLDLVPPILRKYWARFLQPGPWRTWYEAVAWFKGLEGDQVGLANQYLGFQHLDLRPYESLPQTDSPTVTPLVADLLRSEERQRLQDFTEQFELLIGDPDNRENFDFWRGYLHDMRRLNGSHHGFLASLGTSAADEIADTLAVVGALDGLEPAEQAGRVSQALEDQALAVHFLPVLENGTLLEYFAADPKFPDVPTLRGTVAFVERLARLAPVVESVIRAGGDDEQSGTATLASFLETQDFENSRDLDLFFGLLKDADRETAERVVAALDGPTTIRLLEAVPAALRSLLDPERLLEVLGITETATPDELVDGIDILVEHTSGNFRIDEPFLDALYRVIALRTSFDPRVALQVADRSRFPMEGYILRFPEAAVAMLASDPELAAGLVKKSDEVTFPPARFVYRLVHAYPDLAADIVGRLDEQGEDGLVTEALAHFAYDSQRLAQVPGLPIALENDRRFLEALAKEEGSDWLVTNIAGVVRKYRMLAERGDVPSDFVTAYKATLEAAVRSVQGSPKKQELERVVGEVFGGR
ncbi:MAG: hypothetical protein O3A47_00415 [Chloroflexi bacterium]|nr:hypothetical protein [Chloroflexota bacterium]